MKIVFLEAAQSFGGAEKSTLELALRLSKSHEICIIDLFGVNKSLIDFLICHNLNYKIIEPRDKPIVLKSTSNKFGLLKNYLFYIPKWIQYRRRVESILYEFDTNVVFIHNTKTLSMLKKMNNYSIVYFARGWFLPQQLSFISHFFHKQLVDFYIGVSEATRHAIYCGGLAKLKDIYVVHNGIDSSKNTKTKAFIDKGPDDIVILHCAGILPSKGQETSLEIAYKLKALKVPFKLLLVGIIYKGVESYKYLNFIRKKIDEFELADDVEIILNKTDVLEYFNSADIVIHPSYTEGLPRVVMEAMSLGKPVIANAVGGVLDYILNGFTGFLTGFNDANDYVEKIILLKNDKALYNNIVKNAFNLIESGFSEENQMNAIDKLLIRINEKR